MAEHDEQDPDEYGLLMPFVTVASVGGPHEDEPYAAGYQMGRIDGLLEHGVPGFPLEATIGAENLKQADLIAMRHGCVIVHDPAADVDGWAQVKFIPVTPTEEGA